MSAEQPSSASPARRASRWIRRLRPWLALALLAYAAFVLYLWAMQDRRIFVTRPLGAEQAREVLAAHPGASSVFLDAADGARLHAWYRPADGAAERRRLLLYFGASAEDSFWRLGHAARLPGWDLLLVDHRGFGLSSGQPGQAAMEADALAWARASFDGQAGIRAAERVVVMGTSIGAYPAAFLSTHDDLRQRIAGSVLVVPFHSLREHIQAMLPVVPIGPILRHPMESQDLAPAAQAPALFIAGMRDRTVPPDRARRLYERWGSADKHWLALPQADHYSAASDPEYWRTLQAFLQRVAR